MIENTSKRKQKIAIIGGGPSALFLFKRLLESKKSTKFEIHIFERTKELGMGMPYSRYGANKEHITNVSDNEIPNIQTHFEEWLKDAPQALIETFKVDHQTHNPYKVLPRLFFGAYLSAQFGLLLERAKKLKIEHFVHLETNVEDVEFDRTKRKALLKFSNKEAMYVDTAIICTGHHWPKKKESSEKRFFESPYPPVKLQLSANHAVAVTGSSLTAIDAIRTLARSNGQFQHLEDGTYQYLRSAGSPDFKIVVHSLHGVFPGMRFHLTDTHLKDQKLLSAEALKDHIAQNDGFLSLDYIFDKDFKAILKDRDPKTYREIRDFTVEEFASHYDELIHANDPIKSLRSDYEAAEKSIAKEKSLHWREILAMLSFAINYPAKYLSAEDKLRLDKVLMPLISHVIAFIPQSSAREILALADAGVLEIIKVLRESEAVPLAKGGANYHIVDANGQKQIVYYQTYINCMGQQQWDAEDFIFQSLWQQGEISPATYRFRDQAEGTNYYKQQRKKPVLDDDQNVLMPAKGVKVNDAFQLVNRDGMANSQLYLMAVPHMGGYNPDYSGLDFSEEASKLILQAIEESSKIDNSRKATQAA